MYIGLYFANHGSDDFGFIFAAAISFVILVMERRRQQCQSDEKAIDLVDV